MNRNVNAIIKEYENKFEAKNKGQLWSKEVEQIYSMSNNPFDCIVNAFMFGYVLGHKAGKRRERRY